MEFDIPETASFYQSAENLTLLNDDAAKACNVQIRILTNKNYEGNKAFEMWKTLLMAHKFLNKSDRIFFAGCYNDDALYLLSHSGYAKLVAMDSNPAIYGKDEYWKIKYFYGDILDTHLPNSFFKAIFSLGAIENFTEHGGKNYERIGLFFREYNRILSNNGLLVITTNFGPRLVQGKGNNILDEKAVKYIIKLAETYGFLICGDSSFNITDLPIKRNGERYTTIFMAFRLHKREFKNDLKELYIVSPMIKQDGITIYSENLKVKFESIGIRANLVSSAENCHNSKAIIYQYDPGLFQKIPRNNNAFIEMHSTRLRIRGIVYVTLRLRSLKKGFILLRQLLSLSKHHLLIRNNELSKIPTFKLKNYTIVPHLAYPDLGIRAKPNEIFLGSFGFALPFKRFDDVCDLAIRLGVKCKILLSINNASEDMQNTTSSTADIIRKKYSCHPNIEIKTGFFTDEEILTELSVCSHILFAQQNTYQTSGSYRFPTQLKIPVVAVESFQARESQVYRVNSFEDVTIDLLLSWKEPVEIDDGFDYLLAVLTNKN